MATQLTREERGFLCTYIMAQMTIQQIATVMQKDVALITNECRLLFGNLSVLVNGGTMTMTPASSSSRPKIGKRWEQSEKADVLGLYRSGVAVQELAERYNRTVNAIVFELTKNIPITPSAGSTVNSNKKWSKEEAQQLVAQYENGTPLQLLAASFQRSVRSLEHKLLKMNAYKFPV